MSLQHISALEAATEWYLKLTSGEANENDIKAWQEWRNANTEHAIAWQRIEAVTKPFSLVNPQIGLIALDKASKNIQSDSKRQTLKHLSMLFAVAGAAWVGYSDKPWQNLMADYTTAVGESKQIMLADGTKLMINTDSMVALDFSTERRVVILYQGEVLIETGHEQLSQYRPFTLETEDGAITALGTRFGVRKHQNYTNVNLFEGSLKISAKQNPNNPFFLVAGQSLKFGGDGNVKKYSTPSGSDAWENGFLIADKMPLKEFLAELSRYKSGVIRCNPAIAQLEISGAFPTNDIDMVLTSIAKTLPIHIDAFTSYWITINPA